MSNAYPILVKYFVQNLKILILLCFEKHKREDFSSLLLTRMVLDENYDYQMINIGYNKAFNSTTVHISYDGVGLVFLSTRSL